jgi:hypothetical protein
MPTKFASVSFNGKQIIPAPLVSLSRPIIRSAGGEIIGAKWNITLNGNLLSYKGSPQSTGTVGDANWDGAFWIASDYPPDEVPNVKFDMLINKLEHLKNLFNEDGGMLEIQSCDASAPLRAPVRIGELSYQEGKWTDLIPWSIPLEADYLLGGFTPSGSQGTGEFNFPQFLDDATESWQMEFNDQPEGPSKHLQHSFRLTHNLSAKGRQVFDIDGSLIKDSWVWAKEWVQERLGYDQNRVTASGLFNLPSTYNGWNNTRNEQIDIKGGSYSVTESWIVTTGNALETFTVTSDSQVSDPIRRVTIQGEVQGLENVVYTSTGLNLVTSKWEAASGLFSNISGQLYERAYGYAQASDFPRALNPIPQSLQINRNPVNGVISYNFVYDTRRRLCGDDPDVLSENFSISDTNPHQSIAIIPILGRANGPLIQSLNTVSEYQRTMTVDLVMLPPTGCMFSATGIRNIMSQSPYWTYDVSFDAMFNYLLATYDQVYLTSDQESWSNDLTAYSRSVTWTIGNC